MTRLVKERGSKQGDPADPPILRHHLCPFDHEAEAKTKDDAENHGTADKIGNAMSGPCEAEDEPDETGGEALRPTP